MPWFGPDPAKTNDNNIKSCEGCREPGVLIFWVEEQFSSVLRRIWQYFVSPRCKYAYSQHFLCCDCTQKRLPCAQRVTGKAKKSIYHSSTCNRKKIVFVVLQDRRESLESINRKLKE
jgi:hypothetical protein